MPRCSSSAWSRAAFLPLALALAVGCGSNTTPAAAPRSAPPDRAEVAGRQLERAETIAVTPFEREAFLELALEPAVAVPERDAVLERWNRDPRVRILGDPTVEDLRRVAGAIDHWSLITGLAITLVDELPDSETPDSETPDIEIHFVHRAEFASVLQVDRVDPTAVGLTRITFAPSRRGTIDAGIIVIADDDLQVGRNRTIAHEIGHAIGLQHSTCASSLMDGSSDGERSVRWSPNSFDARMTSLLYDRRLRPGIGAAAVDRLLVASEAPGATCEPVDLELVQANGNGRHYLCARGPQAVRPCTANLSLEPVVPIVDPDAWTDGASLSSHSPG